MKLKNQLGYMKVSAWIDTMGKEMRMNVLAWV